jgi:hypothetical protein
MSATLMEVERFLRKTTMSPSRFGRETIGDPRLVFDLRRGRDIRTITVEKIQAYIKQHEALSNVGDGIHPTYKKYDGA